MRTLRWVLLVVGLGAAGYVRLAPSDPADWHVDLAAADFQPIPHAPFTCLAPDSRYAPLSPIEATLAALDKAAKASPRTQVLAQDDGRITWISRSFLWGFPDYTTAQIMPDGQSLCIYARQRFGPRDWGVNRRRLEGWLQQALQLNEEPDL